MTSVIAPTHASSFLHQSSTIAMAMHNSQDPQLMQQQLQEAEQDASDYQVLFCRALYDYVAQDNSALSFRRGDIIEVLNQQPSGWWDGLLGDERGWFPSNYVEIISVEEAELAFPGSDYSNADGMGGMVDMSDALMNGTQAQNEEWLENEVAYADNYDNHDSAPEASQTNDYWEPEVTPDGRVFYVNRRTGQHAQDLPQEAADEISESELAGLSIQGSARTTGAGTIAFGAATNGVNGMHNEPAGFGINRSTGTPEPWVKRLTDDGLSYYYRNKLTGEIRRTHPLPSTSGSDTEDSQFSSSSRSRPTKSRNSIYHDDSDLDPSNPSRPNHAIMSDRILQMQDQAQDAYSPETYGNVALTSEERIAEQLQQALTPPPPEHVTNLSSQAKKAIQAIIDNVQTISGRPGDDQRMDELIHEAVRAIRNLLYVSAASSGHLPNDLLAKETRDKSSSSSPLKPAQRRVTATLSRLVLSARAMHYDSGSHISETLSRIVADAEELDKAGSSFVLEVQRAKQHHEAKPLKRLYGAFTTANVGMGLVGAGSAGSWKGFGWVSQETEEQAPQKHLGQEVITEVSGILAKLDEIFGPFANALYSRKDISVEQIRRRIQQLVTTISQFLSFVTDIHIARHVDIDGIRQGGEVGDNDLYAQTVTRARVLVRTLETSVQAVYDDASTALLTIQAIPTSDINYSSEEQTAAFDLLIFLISSLKLNVALVQQTLEALLSVGHEQADMAQGDYNGSIEWRMSRLSMIHAQFGGAAKTFSNLSQDPAEMEDVLDIESALIRPGSKLSRPSLEHPNETQSYVDQNGSSTINEHSYAGSTAESTLVHERAVVEREEISEEPEFEQAKPPRAGHPSKLINLLGDEYADKVAAESKPWYLRANYNPSEILIEPDNSVRGGTLPALVEKLTAHDQLDLPFMRAFLMTFKSFTTLNELFDLLVLRFRIQPPDNLQPEEMERWMKIKQNVIQTRVINIFKSMVTEQHILEKEDTYIFSRMMEFISAEDVSKMSAAKALRALVERAQSNNDHAVKTFINTNPVPAPQPILPRASKRLKLLDIDPLEMARQLTIMESRLYQLIKPYECLQRPREQKTESNDNIGNVIQTSNRIADWVAQSILSKDDSKKRAQVVKYLINVADRCRTLNNFSTMIAITSGLNTPAIRRLKRTWEYVNQRVLAQFAACEVTIEGNKTYNKYKQTMASVTPPCVPFIGVFLSTLQFIHDGAPDNVEGGLINFRKRQKASEVIDDIKRWQTIPYNLTPVPAIQTFIEESLNQFTDTRASADRFWQLSLEREPREREDEKMARLLQESGFL